MKKIIVCALLNVAFQLTASTPNPSAHPLAEEPKLPVLVRPGHLEFLDECMPSMLSLPKDVDSARALSARIDRMYGERLKSNPNFFRLIKPLMNIEADSTGYHMGFVMSDFRVSFMELCAAKINPPIFTHDEALAALEQPNGPERYESFIMIMSSFSPSTTSLLREVWSKIFTITEEQFVTLKMVTDFLGTKDFDEKATKMPLFLGRMFASAIWGPAYWKKHILPPSSAAAQDLTGAILGNY